MKPFTREIFAVGNRVYHEWSDRAGVVVMILPVALGGEPRYVVRFDGVAYDLDMAHGELEHAAGP